jgi:hypothetical protein
VEEISDDEFERDSKADLEDYDPLYASPQKVELLDNSKIFKRFVSDQQDNFNLL